jgi:hypothetical protein
MEHHFYRFDPLTWSPGRVVDHRAAGVALNLRCFSGGLGQYSQKTHNWGIEAISGVPSP